MKRFFSIIFMILFINLCHAADNTGPTIVFGTTEAYIPYAAVDSAGAVYGFGVSFSQMLCKEMKVRCVYKPMVFKELFTSLRENKIDAAFGAIAITEERQKEFAFTLPYLVSRASIIAKIVPGQPRIKKMTLKNVEAKIFGVQTDSIFAQVFKAHYPNLLSKSFDKVADMAEALENGEIDYMIVDTPVARYWVNTEARHQFYIVGHPFDLHKGIGIMLNKDNPELLAKLNQAIEKVTSTDDFRQLLETFFPTAK